MNNLTQFTKGIIEALIFTDSPEEYDIKGLHRSAKDVIKEIAKDYYNANKDEMQQFIEQECIDWPRLGHLVWYAWQGHGVGFFDYGDTKLANRLDERATDLPYLCSQMSDCGNYLIV